MTRRPADINYTFNNEELAALSAYGTVRRHDAGEILVEPGQSQVDCLVTLSGETHAFIEGPDGPQRLGFMERGQFIGDLGTLTGQTALARTVMGVAGEVLHIPFEKLQKLLVEQSALSDIFVNTFSARRAFARQREVGAIVIIGAPYDRRVFSIRDFLNRHSLPHTWLDPDTDPLAAQLMSAKELSHSDLPAVLLGVDPVLRKPGVDEIAARLGLDLLPDGASADVIVVGAGPAGLAASVYAASEGLTVLTLDSEGPGGQAGTSSKIENYLGFPMGLSGRELADRAALQAQKFGVRMAAPVCAAGLERLEDGAYCLHVKDGRSLKAKAVVVATGAQYRRLPIEGLESFEGRGVYYGASPLEAQLCTGSQATIVGAGNSAGQGAVFLAKSAQDVHVLYRRKDIRDTMSEYLVRRLEETPNIHLHPQTSIEAMHGAEGATPDNQRLTALTLKNPDGSTRLETPFVFLFIGAAPFTDWLPKDLARDEKGFLRTGAQLETLDLVRAGWREDRLPSPFETNLPRIYAVGDVRSGSVKRVASSVGEGSVVVSDIHKAISELVNQGESDNSDNGVQTSSTA